MSGYGGYSNGAAGGGYGGYDYGGARNQAPPPQERDRRRPDERPGNGGSYERRPPQEDRSRGGADGYGTGGGGYGYNAESGRDRSREPPAAPRQQQQQQRSLAPEDKYGTGYGSTRERSKERQGAGTGYGSSQERSQERNGSRARSRPRQAPRNGSDRGYGAGTKRLDDILRIVERDWDFMASEDCTPVKAALQLMDTSSLGRAHQYEDFQATHRELQKALRAIVNDHHQGFNSSIGTYHAIIRSITTSQAKVRELREDLISAKQDLATNKPEVKALVDSSSKYDAMLQSLYSIENLQTVPERLEARISEKRFISAVEVLAEALEAINKPSMMEIGALADLRSYLGSQESSLADILIEELHNHLYLKSLYCNERWKPYTPSMQQEGAGTGSEELEMDKNGTAAYTTSDGKRKLLVFLEETEFTKPMVEDANTTKNPEADSLYYIRLILEALNKLGMLPNAMATVNQRLPVELNKLVAKTNSEVDQRHPTSLTGMGNSTMGNNKTVELGFGDNDIRVTVIHDFFWTLYSKFEAVMEGHRAVYSVIEGLSQRQGSASEDVASLTNGFFEVWQLIQSEMRQLLHDYLTMNENRGTFHSTTRGMQNPMQMVTTSGKAPRDPSKTVFKLADANKQTLKSDEDDLESILKNCVPGLVSESVRPAVVSTDTHHTADGAATGHKMLIEPSVFNISLLLPPSLAFLNRLKEIIPDGCGISISSLPSFLDDFLVNVFHPSLEDTLQHVFNTTTGDLDAFHQDPHWSSVATKPVMKGTVAFLNLITAFCRMLDTIPPDQAFGQLTINLLTGYYDKCYEWYKDLVARVGPEVEDAGGRAGDDMKKSAVWAGRDNIRTILFSLWESPEKAEELLTKENEEELKAKDKEPITQSDLISDRKTINSLCVLCTSMNWLATKVAALRHVTSPEAFSRANDIASPIDSSGRIPLRRRWTLIEDANNQDGMESRPVYLPMTQDTVVLFDGVVSSFRELSSTILYTLHLEARVQAIHHLTRTLTEGSYCLDTKVETPAPTVLAFNTSLVWFDEDITSLLLPPQRTFILSGLSTLISSLLVSSAASINILNRNGVHRMLVNILVLQQNLKNIENPEASLAHAKGFYGLYEMGMDKVVEMVRKGELHGYSYDDLKTLLELYFSEALKQEGGAVQARRSLNDNLLSLSEIMWTL